MYSATLEQNRFLNDGFSEVKLIANGQHQRAIRNIHETQRAFLDALTCHFKVVSVVKSVDSQKRLDRMLPRVLAKRLKVGHVSNPEILELG